VVEIHARLGYLPDFYGLYDKLTVRRCLGYAALSRARDLRIRSVAFPAMGTGVGGFPLDEAARVTVHAVRDELLRSPSIEHVIFAMRGAAAYHAFEAALAAPSGPGPVGPASGSTIGGTVAV